MTELGILVAGLPGSRDGRQSLIGVLGEFSIRNMRTGKRISVWISTMDFDYLKQRKVSPTTLMRAAIRQMQCTHNWYTSDDIT